MIIDIRKKIPVVNQMLTNKQIEDSFHLNRESWSPIVQKVRKHQTQGLKTKSYPMSPLLKTTHTKIYTNTLQNITLLYTKQCKVNKIFLLLQQHGFFKCT